MNQQRENKKMRPVSDTEQYEDRGYMLPFYNLQLRTTA